MRTGQEQLRLRPGWLFTEAASRLGPADDPSATGQLARRSAIDVSFPTAPWSSSGDVAKVGRSPVPHSGTGSTFAGRMRRTAINGAWGARCSGS